LNLYTATGFIATGFQVGGACTLYMTLHYHTENFMVYKTNLSDVIGGYR